LLDEKKINEEHKEANKNVRISQVIINIRKYFFLYDLLTKDVLLCYLGNLYVSSSERPKLIWEVHYIWVA